MTLSYTHRLICLIAAATGLLQTAFEVALYISASLVLRLSASLSSRARERLLYLLQFAPLSLALLLTGSLCVSQYLRTETNLEPESVGRLCLLFALAVLVWFGLAVARGLRVGLRAMCFTAACKKAGTGNGLSYKSLPIVALPCVERRVALAGLFSPFILISRDLIGKGGLNKAALDVALDHERAHAEQFDNWKLLFLYFLPRLPFRLPRGRTWMQLWQNAAEWAADDDAVRGNSARGFLLAEALVAVARPATARGPQVLCTELACGDMELAERIERLIDGPPVPHPSRRGLLLLVLLGTTISASAAAARIAPLLHNLSERLLHLG